MASFYKENLAELFASSHITQQQIDEAIEIVMGNFDLSPEENLEEMINLLVISGDSTLSQNETDGAWGISGNTNQLSEFSKKLLPLFPDICPNYLQQYCDTHKNLSFHEMVEDLSSTDYVKTEQDPLDVWEHLKQMLPDADPNYLKNQARVLATRPSGELQQFIEDAIEKTDYPTMQEYLKNQEITANFDTYNNNFSIDNYLNLVPNPLEKFLDPSRKSLLSGDSDSEDLQFALIFLCNQFLYQRKKEILKVFEHFNRNLVKTCNKLKTLPKAFRQPRQMEEVTFCKNVELLKETAFLKNERAIRQFLKQKDEKYRLALEEAQAWGLLQTCGCCFDDHLIPEECYFCNNGCTFCKECVRLGAESVIGREETRFPCLAECDSEFDYSTLQMVLDPKIFERLWHRKQIEEIKNANLDGLEECPFCDFCMIPNEEDKIFKCRNVECMAESCRKCRHKSHIPLRCDEIEYDEDVKMRTFIENKMTESLLKKCTKCSKQFYKESGCNKMTCTCGNKMCYVCGQTVASYAHFGANGCPLYTDNLKEFHLNRVMQGAQAAKQELGISNNPQKLKFDPTRNVERDVL